MRFILASASPRRKILMRKVVRNFYCISVEHVEKEYSDLSPKEKVKRISKDKCITALNKLKITGDDVIITGDTVVDIDGVIFGKPKDSYDAYRMLKLLSGRSHKVRSAVTVAYKGKFYTTADTTNVYFTDVDDAVIFDYTQTPEPYDKAGGYAIQGFMGKYNILLK
jgi:septum formation protein